LPRDLQVEQRSSGAKEEELLVVSNSSDIIVFARTCRLDLLEGIFRKSRSLADEIKLIDRKSVSVSGGGYGKGYTG